MQSDWHSHSGSARPLLWAVLVVLVMVILYPEIERWFIAMTAQPRAVIPRGALADDERNTVEIFEAVSPSVVYITTLKRVVNRWTRDVTEVPRGTGSGLIWDDRGHVVTNLHVVQGAGAAEVRLADQRTYKASLVGASAQHDIAVLRIDVAFDRPPPVPLGTSADLRVGQKVFAIGNPFGLDHSLTTGVISALDRSIQGDNGSPIEHLIQTDAAINPGNSGGPLIDSAGRLIGINTAIYSPSGAYAGIGFAVPVDNVNRVVPRLITSGRYVTPTLGIRVDDDISTALTREMGITGVVILQVVDGSPAQRAGLREIRLTTDGGVIPGDVVQAVDGQVVKRIGDIQTILEERRIGDRVELRIYREGHPLTLKIPLEQWSG
jgi:S1-C subfamily serine protease